MGKVTGLELEDVYSHSKFAIGEVVSLPDNNDRTAYKLSVKPKYSPGGKHKIKTLFEAVLSRSDRMAASPDSDLWEEWTRTGERRIDISTFTAKGALKKAARSIDPNPLIDLPKKV